MENKRVVGGFMIQTYDMNTGKYVGEEFVAEDEILETSGAKTPSDSNLSVRVPGASSEIQNEEDDEEYVSLSNVLLFLSMLIAFPAPTVFLFGAWLLFGRNSSGV